MEGLSRRLASGYLCHAPHAPVGRARVGFSHVRQDRFPSGIRAHARTFGKRLSPAWMGVTVVIGLPLEQQQQLGLGAEGDFSTADGVVYCVEDEAQAQMLFTRWVGA